MNRKCRADGDFVRRFRLNVSLEPIRMKADIWVTDLQLFVFYNGVAFLTVYLSYRNQDVDRKRNGRTNYEENSRII